MKHDPKTVTVWQLGSGAVLLSLVITLLSTVASAQAITLGEAVDNTALTWTTGGDADWFGQTSVYYYIMRPTPAGEGR